MWLDQVIENVLVNVIGCDVFVYCFEGVKMDIEIGIYDYECGVKQCVLVDVVILVDKVWCGNDDINIVVDYDYILYGIKDMEECQFDFQEILCGEILDIVLGFDSVVVVQVIMCKLDVYLDVEVVGLMWFWWKG